MGGGGEYDLFYLLSTDKMRGRSRINGSDSDVEGTTNIDTETWYQSVYTYDGSTQTIKLDGTQENTTSNSGTPVTGTNPLVIGARSGNTSYLEWDGLIDEVRIRSGALSTDWFGAEYDNQNTPEPFYFIGTQETDTATSTPSVYKQSEFWFITL